MDAPAGRYTPAQVEAAARRLVGTPWLHCGRTPGPGGGLDCVGVLVALARDIGYPCKDHGAYARTPAGESLLNALNACLDPLDVRCMGPGDIVVFWMDPRTRQAQHVAVLVASPCGLGMVHTWDRGRQDDRVVEVHLNQTWRRRVCAAYRLRGMVRED